MPYAAPELLLPSLDSAIAFGPAASGIEGHQIVLECWALALGVSKERTGGNPRITLRQYALLFYARF